MTATTIDVAGIVSQITASATSISTIGVAVGGIIALVCAFGFIYKMIR